MDRRGQYFLIAAVAIAFVLIGIGTIYVSINSSKEDIVVYDLSSEITYEASQVIDRGIIDSSSQSDIASNISQLASFYLESNPDVDFTIIYGDFNRIYIINSSNQEIGSIDINTGVYGSGVKIIVSERQIDQVALTEPGILIEIKIDEGNDPITFRLKEGQNFYVVVQRQTGDDRVVVSN